MARQIQPFFSRGEISPKLYGRVDTAAYQAGLRRARNSLVLVGGGIMNRPGLTYIGPVKYHDRFTRLIPFEFRSDDTHILEFGHQYMRILREDFYVVEGPFNITDITDANPARVTAPGHDFSNGDEVQLFAVNGMDEVNAKRFLVANVSGDEFDLADQVDGSLIDGTNFEPYISGGQVARIYEIETPYTEGDLATLKYVQSADVMTLTHPSYQVRELRRFDIDDWTLTPATFVPQAPSPSGVNVTANNAGDETYTYAVTAVDELSQEESLPTTAVVNNAAAPDATQDPLDNTVSWSAQSGVLRFVIYREKNGIFGFIGEAEGTSFLDDNIEPDITEGPPRERNPFSGTGNFPSASTFYQQRRIFGGSNNEPDTWHASKTGTFDNFTRAFPVRADDAIEATLAAREVNHIRHFVPFKDLLVFTSGSEWSISSGGEITFAPDTIQQAPQTNWGSSHRQPIVIGNAVIFVQENNTTVRSLGYSFENDGYSSNDLSLLSEHLFNDFPIIDWSLSTSPDQFVSITRQDGDACILTFNTEQNVIAWTHWDTQGFFLTTAATRVCPGTAQDFVYFTVLRDVNGRRVQYIERTSTRHLNDVRDGLFVDSGVSYNVPIPIDRVAYADNRVRVVIPNHGFEDGELIEIDDIVWKGESIDEKGNLTTPNSLNRRQWVVHDPHLNTFGLRDPTTSQIMTETAMPDLPTYDSGGEVRLAIDEVYNLEHLEGLSLSVIGDGVVAENVVVENGRVQLPFPASRVHIGLPFVSEIETLNLEGPTNAETIQGRKKKVYSLTLRFDKSRELLVGPNPDQLTPMRPVPFVDDSTELFTGDRQLIISPTWNTNGRIFIRNVDPTPFTLLAVIPEFTAGD